MPGPRAPTHHSAIHSVLDGFRLLHKAKVRNPCDVYRVDISGQHLDKVVEKDLLLFTNLYSLIANENRLDLLDLSFLPQLRELRIVNNRISNLPPQVAFQMPLLTTLDISFNNLAPNSIAVLAALPNLRLLDISFCEISRFPVDIANMNVWWSQFDEIDKSMVLPGFLKLESLNLSNNKICDGPSLMDILKCMPSLVKLELQHNLIESVFTSTSTKMQGRPGFSKLEELDVSNNAISTPEGIMGIAWLPRIKDVSITNNPITIKEESSVEINDIENGETLGHIAFNPFAILQDVYGINVKDAPVGRKKMVTVKTGPFNVKAESERLSGIKKYALKDEDIAKLLDRKCSVSVDQIEAEKCAQESLPKEKISEPSSPGHDGTFITSVPILEAQSSLAKLRDLIPKPSFNFPSTTLTHDDLAITLPNTIPASVKALRLALETPASFWRISRYTKSVAEYQELMKGIKENKQNVKVDMTYKNHKWARVENETIHKLMQAIDDKIADIDERMRSFHY